MILRMIKKLEIEQKNYNEARCKLIIISTTFIIFVTIRVIASTLYIIHDHTKLYTVILNTVPVFLVFELILISLVIYVDYKNYSE